MKKFSFRLQSLLKYRQYLELVAKQEVARAQKDLKESELRILDLNEEGLRVARALDRVSAGGIRAIEFKSYRDYIDGVDDDMNREVKRKITLENVLGKKQAALTKKSVDKKMLERLKKRKNREYLEEFLKGEQKSSDEISSLKKAREIIDAIS